jgi:glutamyl-tRNA synthetase
MVATPPSDDQAALIEAAAPLIQTRISRLTEAVGMLSFLFAGDDGGFKIEPEDAERVLTPEALPALRAAETALATVEPWTHEAIDAALRAALIEGLGQKPRVAFTPVRVAVTGKRVAPPLFQSIELLGRERTLHRLAAAIKSIG